MGVGLRPGAKAAGRATDPLPATRLPSTLHESGRYYIVPSGRRRALTSTLPETDGRVSRSGPRVDWGSRRPS